ncbi:FMN-dependent NADH-azoreductase [Lacticaseibacillus mingshuiensis]|uniref:FMN-dependent NADH-azoreductase n=1 Tax=Lacticaseibacillus mingshuiensis TaxID=2799574 RepID=UPI0019509224|nr:NAD(P)H-dependent oxidoreductase [Lacticaseibacillus mingshuiensis]
MNTLLINAHPDYLNPAHYSLQLAVQFSQRFHAQFPAETLVERDLYEAPLPQVVNGQLYSMWAKQAQGKSLNPGESAAQRANRALLDEFKAAHRIVIVEPLHNFNVTSRLKDYIDNILVARETFRYTADGSVGLMTDDRRVLLLQGSGSIYTNDDRYTPLEFSRTYLRAIFTELMGFDRFQIVRAQGTQVQDADPEKIQAQATADLAREFSRFYA